ncbi:ATP-binding protein [Roseospira visakhapatnamensis]|uniref:Anti-sigma regulatory factor (Ser/Thr protein kinase) n=1 Tax=Roseospira visakhapatnamensis TaxID=390880 RepID=A0A7W6RDI0_9PROT|nr:ATP-binding protein [Roseospira visakhapatnamensis]MBB4266576.1 anti-sigma regulatory factor (Ser/Thr protein kinase) [Roseospira visakhapatnamensis]
MPDRLEVSACATRLRLLIDFVARVCQVRGVPLSTQHRAELLVEELFANTLLHGGVTDTDAKVRLTIEETDGTLRMDYEDPGRPFDPTGPTPPAPGVPAEDIPIGGAGLRIIQALAQDIGYERRDGLNRVTLRVMGPRGRLF